jgi:hypothetical protein
VHRIKNISDEVHEDNIRITLRHKIRGEEHENDYKWRAR